MNSNLGRPRSADQRLMSIKQLIMEFESDHRYQTQLPMNTATVWGLLDKIKAASYGMTIGKDLNKKAVQFIEKELNAARNRFNPFTSATIEREYRRELDQNYVPLERTELDSGDHE